MTFTIILSPDPTSNDKGNNKCGRFIIFILLQKNIYNDIGKSSEFRIIFNHNQIEHSSFLY